MQRPFPNSHWVVPGRLLAGEHPRERVVLLQEAGIDYFVDLTGRDEVGDYRAQLARGSQYLRSPIVDQHVPDEIVQMQTLQLQLRNALALGRHIYLHCRAGIGRTNLVVGCYLAEQGLDGAAALAKLNRLWRQNALAEQWPTVPQTEEQADYVRDWPNHRRGAVRADMIKARE